MADLKQPLAILAELVLSFAIVFAIAIFVTWDANLSAWDAGDRFLVVWLSSGLFAMLQIRRIK